MFAINSLCVIIFFHASGVFVLQMTSNAGQVLLEVFLSQLEGINAVVG